MNSAEEIEKAPCGTTSPRSPHPSRAVGPCPELPPPGQPNGDAHLRVEAPDLQVWEVQLCPAALGSSASRWPSSSKATVGQRQSHQGRSSHDHAHPSRAVTGVTGAVWGGGRAGRSPALPSPQEAGPTMVGDEHSDPTLMSFLGATKRNMLGNHL